MDLETETLKETSKTNIKRKHAQNSVMTSMKNARQLVQRVREATLELNTKLLVSSLETSFRP